MIMTTTSIANSSFDPRLIFVLISILGLTGLKQFYNWNNTGINTIIPLGYLTILGFEFLYLNLPNLHAGASTEKGLILDAMLYIVPLFYIGFRMILILPLLFQVVQSIINSQTR